MIDDNSVDKWLYVPSFYKPVSDKEIWLPCPVCKEKPRIWVFDNGRHAKCICNIYNNVIGKVSVESILDVYRRDGHVEKYDFDGLRKAWNKHIKRMNKKRSNHG